MYFVSSYLFAHFVDMQQKGLFEDKDYRLRYYYIMVTRIPMAGKIELPKPDSKDMQKECESIIHILKTNADEFYIKSKTILEGVLLEAPFNGKKIRDVLRTVEFCNSVKQATKIYMEEQ